MGSYDSTRTSFLPTIGKPLVHDLAEVDPIVARGLARHYILSDKLVFAIRRRRKAETDLAHQRSHSAHYP